MGREYRVLRGLNDVGYPTPRTIALCEDPSVNGSPFLVMEYVDGRIVATADDAAALSPDERGGVSAALVAALAQLHRVDVAAAGLGELGRPEGYLPRQLGRWTKQWELTKTRDLPRWTSCADASRRPSRRSRRTCPGRSSTATTGSTT